MSAGGDALRECPFCGGTHARETVILRDGCVEGEPEAYAHFVVCLSCAAHGPWFKNEGNAIAAWNRRAALATRAPGDARERLAERIEHAIWRHDLDLTGGHDDRYSWWAHCECGWHYGPAKVSEVRCNWWRHIAGVAAAALAAPAPGDERERLAHALVSVAYVFEETLGDIHAGSLRAAARALRSPVAPALDRERLDALLGMWCQFAYPTGNPEWPYQDGGLSALEDAAPVLIAAGLLERREAPKDRMYRLAARTEGADE